MPAPPDALAPEPGRPMYVGRNVVLPEGRRFDWPASGVRVRFRGAVLRAVLDEHGHDEVEIRLDGAVHQAAVTLRRGENELRVEAGPADVEHVVEIAKRTEAREGFFVVTSVSAEGGQLLPLAARPRLEVVGDSISTGFGIQPSRPDGTCSFVVREQNALATYAAELARLHDLDASIVAVSSKTTREMTAFYERAWPAEEAPPYAFDDPKPAAVVVLLGTNDFFHRNPDKGTFVHDTLALVARIRSHRGADVPVLLGLSPMLSDAYPHGARHRTLARRYFEAAIARARTRGDAAVHFLELAEPTPEQGWGCSAHPSTSTHHTMATTLSQFFDREHLLR